MLHEKIVTQFKEDPVTYLIQYFSSWTRLKKSIAWFLRIKDWLLFLFEEKEALTSESLTTRNRKK